MRPTHSCPNCGLLSLTPVQQFVGRATLGTAGLLFGGQVVKSPIAAVLSTVAGLWLGNTIDQRCPQCGAVLQVLQIL